MREAHEEIGLEPQFVDVLGAMPTYTTGTGFIVTPIVGFVRPGFNVKADPFEVAEVFEVPLAFLMNPENHQIHNKEFRGIERSYYAMPYAERYIWGATAGILRVLYERIYLS